MNKLLTIIALMLFAVSFLSAENFLNNRQIVPASQETIDAIKATLTNDFAVSKAAQHSVGKSLAQTDTLTNYLQRTTEFRIYGINVGGSTYPLVGTNPIYYFVGQKFNITSQMIGNFRLNGILIPFGINVTSGNGKDLSAIWAYPTNTQGIPSGAPFAIAEYSLANADSNSTTQVYSYAPFDSTGDITQDFVIFMQTRNQSDAESDFIAIWANDQGNGMNESKAAVLLVQNNQLAFANFSDLNIDMGGGLGPDFDVLFLPVLERIDGTDIGDEISIGGFTVNGISPNPMTNHATINFSIEKQSRVSIELLNMRGVRMLSIADTEMGAGEHSVRFDASDVPSGSYLIVFRSAGTAFAIKTLIAR